MRWIRRSAVVCLLALLATGVSRAGEEREERPGPDARAGVLERALDLLRIRLEARLEAGRALLALGRPEEALEAFRGIEEDHARGMAQVEDLLRRVEPPAAPGEIVDVPFEGPASGGAIGIGGGAGGAFRGRGGQKDLATSGGGKASQTAVDRALRWLAAHQSPSGAWEAAGFARVCDGKPVEETADGPGKAVYDVGVTGLALCAFLGAGYTNRGRHPYAEAVSRGLAWLKEVQDAEGCFGPRTSPHFAYNHAMAALAMVEAFGMTESPVLKGSAQRALDFIAQARNPYLVWRYGVRPGDNDTSVTGWMMMPLKSAELVNRDAVSRGKPAPLEIDAAAFDGIRAWIDKMTDPDTGRVGYIQRGSGPARPVEMIDRFPAERSESMTAVGMLARIFLGEDPSKSEMIQKGADLCMRLPPRWNPDDGSIDMIYWYYGTLALFQVGGERWKAWNEALKPAVVDTQRRDGDVCGVLGSWDPVGPWGPDGGRVYATALMTLSLEVYYRYARVGKGGR